MWANLIQNSLFSVAQTLIAWHFLSCTEHSKFIGFLMALGAGASWILSLVQFRADVLERNNGKDT